MNTRHTLVALIALIACSVSGYAMASDASRPMVSGSLSTTSVGGRWSATLDPVGNSHRLLIRDTETGKLYEPFELHSYGLQSFEWVSENEFETQLAGGPLRIRIEAPESEGGSAKFFMVPDPDRPRGDGEIENPPGFDAPPVKAYNTFDSDPRRDEKQRNQRILDRQNSRSNRP